MNNLQQNANNEEDLRLDNVGIDKKNIGKRAKRKFFSSILTGKLLEYTKNLDINNHFTEQDRIYWIKRYGKTHGCSNVLEKTHDKYSSEFCKYKICPICNSITTARNILRYKDAIDKLPDKQLLTLTIPNVSAKELSKTIREMTENFQKIKDLLRKKSSHRNAFNIVGTRNLEITFNPKYLDTVKYFGKDYGNKILHETGKCYHPHFHCIISGLELDEATIEDYRICFGKNAVITGLDVSNAIIREWLKLYPHARLDCQDVRPLGDSQKDLLECFKYSMKFLPDKSDAYYYTNKIEIVNEFDELQVLCGHFKVELSQIYIEAVDVINKAVAGVNGAGVVRTFQAFGGIKAKAEEELPDDNEVLKNIEKFEPEFYKYQFNVEYGEYSWYSTETGECVFDFTPNVNLAKFLQCYKFVKSNDFDGNFTKHNRKKKTVPFDKMDYKQKRMAYKKQLEDGSYDFSEASVKSFYTELCKDLKLEVKTIEIAQKMMSGVLGDYRYQDSRIRILKDKKAWRMTVIHEVAHYYVDVKMNIGYHRHTSVFKKIELEFLEKFLEGYLRSGSEDDKYNARKVLK